MRKFYTLLFTTLLMGIMSGQTTVDFTLEEGYVQGPLEASSDWGGTNWFVNPTPGAERAETTGGYSWARWGTPFIVSDTEISFEVHFRFNIDLPAGKLISRFGFNDNGSSSGTIANIQLSTLNDGSLYIRKQGNTPVDSGSAGLTDFQQDDLVIMMVLTLGADAASSSMSSTITNVTDNINSGVAVVNGIPDAVFNAATSGGISGFIHAQDNINGTRSFLVDKVVMTQGNTLNEDTTVPVITLLGDDPVTIEVGNTYIDAGATAADNYDGDITSSIVTISNVDTAVVGTYTVRYDVSDAAGNSAVTVIRNVNVIEDSVAPVITTVDFTLEEGYVQGALDSNPDWGGSNWFVNPTPGTERAETTGGYSWARWGTPFIVSDTEISFEVHFRFNIDLPAGKLISRFGFNDNGSSSGTIANIQLSTLNDGSLSIRKQGNTPVDSGSAVLTDFQQDDLVIMIVLTLGADAASSSMSSTITNVTDNINSGIAVVNGIPAAVFNAATSGGISGFIHAQDNINGTRGFLVDKVVMTQGNTLNEDTTVPVITLLGDDPVTIEVGDTYIDAGATALDNLDGDITSSIETVSNVDTAIVGTYTVAYNVSDASGNAAAEVTRTINVVDTTIPVITLLGDDPVTIEVGDTYIDVGATATDTYDGDITSSIVTLSNVDTAIVGIYSVAFNVSDTSGNAAAEVTRTVNVVDTTVPVIVLLGDDSVTIEVGDTYIDAGATATDTYDGDITSSIVTVSNVDTAIVGIYSVAFNVSDTSGNAAAEVTRTVNVVDTTVPVIALLGDNPVTIEVGDTYIDAGATAADTYDGDITSSIVTVSTVNTAIVGVYTIWYNVSDSSGNTAAELIRTVNVEDTTLPVITLLGDNPVTIEVGSTYTDAGATATDTYDGDITSSIVTVSTVNTAIVGVYTVTYNVSDASGNEAAEVTRTINVVDTTIPVITLLGVAGTSVAVGDTYTDAGATATDNYDGDITSIIVTVSTVNTAIVGIYTVSYNVSDASGNAALEVIRDVVVVDTTIPVITLLGDDPVTVEVGSTYTDAGATATDTYDGDITSSIVTISNVDTAVVGSYTVRYNVSNSSGNAALEVTRTVNVVDTTVPVITLLGQTATIEAGDTYTDAGATATDNYDGDITSIIVTVSTVNTAIVGIYTVSYNVSDASSNAALEVIRDVVVVDTTIPVITLLGDDPVTIEVGDTYTDAGATATDNYDGDITSSIETVSNVDIAIVGTYTVIYDVVDANGNAAITVTRTVNVLDTTLPVITLLGDNPATIEAGDTYTDAGATATDTYDGDITSSIVTMSNVDTAIVGTYTVTYDVADANGNAAITVTRTVNVVDTTLPVITLLGDNPVTLEVGDTYTDAGATATDTYDGDITSSIVTISNVDTAIAGTYTVTYDVADANGNAAITVTRIVNVDDNLSAVEIDTIKLNIFPNPTSNFWYIKSSEIIESLDLFDFTGKRLINKKTFSNDTRIDATYLPDGIYLILINNNTFVSLIKH